MFSFTRGIKNTTQYFLNFSRDSNYLISTSNTGTIHVFQLDDSTSEKSKQSIVDENRVVVIKNKKSSFLDFFLPKACDDYIHAEKSLISANHTELSERTNIIAMDFSNN